MPRLYFLDWSRPLLPALAEWLIPDPSPRKLTDLSGTLVVVPTAGAGRSLREALVRRAGGRGLLPPRIATPGILLDPDASSGPPAADDGMTLTAWAAVLLELKLSEWRTLFPVDPPTRDVPWALRTATEFTRLRHHLGEGNYSAAGAAAALGEDHPESARWDAFARLERRVEQLLHQAGWLDPVRCRMEAVENPILPEGIQRLVIAAVPDPIYAVQRAWQRLEELGQVSAEILVHAPAALAAAFDEWGRPRPEIWNTRLILLPEGPGSVRIVPRPAEEAEAMTRAMEDIPPGEGVLGSGDPEVTVPLQRVAAGEGITIFDPDGVSLLNHEISWLIRCLSQFLRSGSWTAAGQLLRIPEVLECAAGSARLVPVLKEWDRFQKDRLPLRVEWALPLLEDWLSMQKKPASEQEIGTGEDRPSFLPRILQWFLDQQQRFQTHEAGSVLSQFLHEVYGRRTFATPGERERFLQALAAWQEGIESIGRGAAIFATGMTAAEIYEAAASLLSGAKLYAALPENAVPLHGWLELPWQEGIHLVVAGLNEGMVPDSVTGDAWLPDGVRASLRLKNNGTRLARDSFLLTTLIESRRRVGSVQLLAARETSNGDPLKPSRLLLRCPPEELPARALSLFPRGSEESARTVPVPPWQRAWPLKVPPPPPDSKIHQRLSVTAFTDYLKCPFRFYLKHVLHMETYEATQAELDAASFGSLFHEVMQSLHLHPELRNGTDAGPITGFLLHTMEALVKKWYGPHLNLPVAVQMDTLRNCLRKAASLHAAERAAGWRFEQVEIDFPRLPGSDEPVRIDGIAIRGRIDLIERHPDLGYRILDYKTSAKASVPAAAHLEKFRGNPESAPPWKQITIEGKPYLWKNLQLPLYASIMSRHYGKPVAAGYVNLPRALSEARVEMWDDLSPELLQSASECAAGVIGSIRAGLFWPPADKLRFDPWKSLIFRSVPLSFDIRALAPEKIPPGSVAEVPCS